MNDCAHVLTAGRAMRTGDLTPLRLVEACIDQIRARGDGLRAWVHLDTRGALREAQRLTEELAAGQDRGPLHGIPIGVKDIIDVQGDVTCCGTLPDFNAWQPAAADATVVARLRQAGAILLGKTVTTEFACFDPAETVNPWNPAHTPGGSSCGSAVAVATRMCLGALASQTGGSITRPASYCGVAGIKPSFGRVSRQGVTPVSFHLDHVGIMARTAAECAVFFSVIADPPSRGGSARPAGSPSGPSFATSLARTPRLGVIRPFFLEECTNDVAQQTRQSLAQLQASGATLIEVPLPPGFEQVHPMHRRLMACEAAEFHHRAFGAPRAGYRPQLTGLLDEGFSLSMPEYQEALRHQMEFTAAVEDVLPEVDAWVTPATTTAAPASRQTTGDPRFNSPWSYAGVPTVSIPCGLDPAGLPLGLQFIAARGLDEHLLSVAIWCEQRLGFNAQPPDTAA